MAITPNAQVFDPEVGRSAYEKLKPLLDALKPEELVPPTAKVNRAATFAVGVQRELEAEPLQQQLLSMPGIRRELATDLESTAWACWYAWTKAQDAAAVAGGTRVDTELLERATERRERLLTLLHYHLGEEPSVARTLDTIRPGTGYQDLASDLVRLSRLWQENRPLLEGDQKNFREEDGEGANADAAAIIQTLAHASEQEERWTERLTRTWTLLLRAYAEVQSALQWIYREDPRALDRFPSLYSVARGGGRSRSRPAPQPSPPVAAAAP